MSIERGSGRHVLDGIAIERISTLDRMHAASDMWGKLLANDSRAGLFQSPQVFFAWQATCPAVGEPWLLVARIGGVPVGCVPLVRRMTSRRGIRMRVLSLGNPRADVVALAEHRTDVVGAVGRYLDAHAKEWDMLSIENVRVDGGTIDMLQAQLGASMVGAGLEEAPCEAYLDVARPWEEYLKVKGRHFRNRLRPQCDRIQSAGTVTFRRSAGRGDADRSMDELIAIGARSWKGASGTALDPGEERFFRHLMRHVDDTLDYDVLFLEVDGAAVAGLLSIRHARRYYLFLTYFEERLREYYPGRALMREAVRHAFSRTDVDEVSFISDYAFARSWADGIRDYRSARFYGGGIRARCARTLDRWDRRAAPEKPQEQAA